MAGDIEITIRNQRVLLSAERTAFFSDQSTLVLADLHLGKAGHFRKNGLPIPQNVSIKDVDRLFSQIDLYSPQHVVVAGDFFHAQLNNEVKLIQHQISNYNHVHFHLVRGNHDRWHNERYEKLGFQLWNDHYAIHDEIIVRHEAITEDVQFQISGHIHPGIILEGRGRQYMRLPCFHYNDNTLILPAFSLFTGLDTKFELENQKSVVICEGEVMGI